LRTPGAKQRQVGIRASIERQIDDLLPVYDLAAGACVGFEQLHRIRRNGDRLGEGAGLESKIHTLTGIHCDLHVLGQGLRESL
jgi:hypothetical protein